MVSNDNCSMAVLIMFELIATLVILAFASIYIYYKRFFNKKSLNGQIVVITNGDSELSKELSHQLTAQHKCHVILIRNNLFVNKNHDSNNNNSGNSDKRYANLSSNNNNNNLTAANEKLDLQKNVLFLNSNNHSKCQPMNALTVECNLLNNEELERYSAMIHNLYGHIDILIENKMDSSDRQAGAVDCISFINSTSDSIRASINLLIHFIPKLYQSPTGGHYITIEPNNGFTTSPSGPRSDIKNLINNLVANQTSSSSSSSSQHDKFNVSKSMNIEISTVILSRRKPIKKRDNNCNLVINKNNNKNSNDNDINVNRNNCNNNNNILSLKEITEEILNNIRCERKIANISEQRKQTARFYYFLKNKFRKN